MTRLVCQMIEKRTPLLLLNALAGSKAIIFKKMRQTRLSILWYLEQNKHVQKKKRKENRRAVAAVM